MVKQFLPDVAPEGYWFILNLGPRSPLSSKETKMEKKTMK